MGPHHVAQKKNSRSSSSNLSRGSPVRKNFPCLSRITTLSVSRLFGVHWLDDTLNRNDLEGRKRHLIETYQNLPEGLRRITIKLMTVDISAEIRIEQLPSKSLELYRCAIPLSISMFQLNMTTFAAIVSTTAMRHQYWVRHEHLPWFCLPVTRCE
jgi:hypothetical protein